MQCVADALSKGADAWYVGIHLERKMTEQSQLPLTCIQKDSLQYMNKIILTDLFGCLPKQASHKTALSFFLFKTQDSLSWKQGSRDGKGANPLTKYCKLIDSKE